MGGGGDVEEIDTDVNGAVNRANDFLNNALLIGLPYSEQFTRQAVEAQQMAEKQSRADQESGFQRAQGLQAPYRLAGYQALDSYLDTLTQARPEMGSFKLANALESNAKRDQALSQMDIDTEAMRTKYGLGFSNAMALDPVTRQYSPGVFNEKAIKIMDDMVQNNWIASAFSKNGWIPLDAMPAGSTFTDRSGHTEGSDQRGPNATVGGMDSSTIRMPPGMIPSLQYQWASDAAKKILSDYKVATQYYTPEQGSIAASFNKGLLGDPTWSNVGGANPYLGTAALRTGKEV